MKKLTFLLSLSAFFTSVSFAQVPAPQVIGEVISVDGLSTVVQNNTIGNISKGNLLFDNARVATTVNSFTTIRLRNDCNIFLKPSEVVTLDLRRPCNEILASIKSTGPTVASGAGGGVRTVGVGDALIIGVGALTSFVVIRDLLSGS